MGEAIRLRLELAGAVQGVGFRPCVHKLAGQLDLAGWVRNSAAGVEIEIEGPPDIVESFPQQLGQQLPPHASITSSQQRKIPPVGERDFRIEHSDASVAGSAPAEVIPDLATCSDCLAEILDPTDRRYGYPFTNCTHCGPRFSIVLDLPYDRANTTMRKFEMCRSCSEEYSSPEDRRFHAQPNACPDCGPQLTWLDSSGQALAERADALDHAAVAIEEGQIVAVKGIGGFHLFTDARNAESIEQLRQRKHRPAKPFALMMPSLKMTREHLQVSEQQATWLTSAAAPIVLLHRRPECDLPAALAPGNPWLGVMLPYSPLHHLLLRRLAFPLVATSGNLGDEPICIDNDEAVERLNGIANAFLVHDRPIARAVDDSVMREAAGREMVLRRSRGFAPAPIAAPEIESSILAYGGDLKGTLAVADRGRVRLSQHLGDLASLESRRAYQRHLLDFPKLCHSEPQTIACDRHPSYHSRQLADGGQLPVVTIQHHHAHAIACATENGIAPDEQFLAVSWDGTGYGEDGTIWGGEFLLCRGSEFERFAWLRPFPLPGGEKAVRDPRFAALGCLHAAGINVEKTSLADKLSSEECRIGNSLIDRGINSPLTSSAGRLFDAVSALCGISCEITFEGQAAMTLEFAAAQAPQAAAYELSTTTGEIDWTPLLHQVVKDLNQNGAAPATVAHRFHLTLAELIASTAKLAECETVALTGGCFQNALLLELSIASLQRAGLRPIWHRQLPPNDGSLAFGQAVVASRLISSQVG